MPAPSLCGDMSTAWIRASRLTPCAAAAVVVAAVSLLGHGVLVAIPYLTEMVPLELLVAMPAAVIAFVPTLEQFESWHVSASRSALVRCAQAAASLLLFVIAQSPTLVLAGPDSVEFRFGLLLYVIGLGSVLLVGELAWLAVLAVGFTVLLVDPQLWRLFPSTTSVPSVVLWPSLLALAAMLAALGPRVLARLVRRVPLV